MDIAAIVARSPVIPVLTMPQSVVGAGTVLEPRQFDAVQQAGARGVVSPGSTPALVTAARAAGLPFLPGIQTAQAYLVPANVACVGGSWMAPKETVLSGDWAKIEGLAAAAAQLRRS